jgi:NitT/TauT family transport system substrate-binding protein
MSKTTRREFANGMALTAAAAILGVSPKPADAEPPPEMTRLRLARYDDHACLAPQWVAEELLRAEGFTDIEYTMTVNPVGDLIAGKLDFAAFEIMGLLLSLEAAPPVVVIAGIHAGCYELFGTSRVRSLLDLKNRTIAVGAYGGSQALVTAMAAYVGLDPRRDTRFVSPPSNEAMQLLADGKIDAMLGFPPEPQELRTRKIGHVVVSTREDRPWSRYFCCMAVARETFVTKYPVATKRMLRAFLKASDMCALEPDRMGRFLVDQGFSKNYDYTVQTLKEISWTRWRDYDPADSMRFYALRLLETGLIKASPQKILARSTNWRFINELKKELKA